MRTVLAILLALWVPLAGCAVPSEEVVSQCREGEGPYFVRAQSHPGFSPPEFQYVLYTLDRDDQLTLVRAHEERQAGGSGRVVPADGALHNVTVDQVRTVLQALDVYRASVDYNVTLAWRDTAGDADVADFCAVVLDDFYQMDARYENPLIADCGGFTFHVSTARGEHSSYSYCNEGPRAVYDAWEALVDESEERLGVPGPYEFK